MYIKYTQKSGFKVNFNMKSPSEIAELLKTKWDLNLRGGVIIANPIPKDKQLDFDVMQNAIDKALIEERELGIKGKDSTPFLLGKVKELTDGLSLDANIELVYNNFKNAATQIVMTEQFLPIVPMQGEANVNSDYIYEPSNHVVNPSSEIACNSTQSNSEKKGNDY